MFYTLSNLQKNHYSLKKKLFIFLQGIALFYLLALFSVMLMAGVDEFISKELNFPSIAKTFRESSFRIKEKYSPFFIIIIGPFLEELLFRLILVPNIKNLTFFTFILSVFISYGGVYPKEVDSKLFIVVFVCLMLSWLLWIILSRYNEIEIYINSLQKYLVMVFSLFFGLIHIGNVDKIYNELILLYPIYVLPQIIMGYFCSILRIKFGFMWGVGFHSFINGVTMLLR